MTSRPLLRRHPSLKQIVSGFTLIELMVSVVITTVLLAGAAVALTQHVRTSKDVEFIQSMRNDLKRLTFLLETEVKEGSAIQTAQAVSCATGTNSLFTITVPQLGTTGTNLTNSFIHYYATGTGNTATLMRCGPPINNNGTLNFSGTSAAATVSSNTTLTVSSASTKAVTYDITLRDPAAIKSVTRSMITNRVGNTLIN